MNKKDLFFLGIEESVTRFSVRCKKTSCIENIRILGGSTENAKAPPILEMNKIYASIGFSTTQSVGNYPESSFTFKNKFYTVF